MTAVTPSDGFEMLLETAQWLSHGAQQQPACSGRRQEGEYEGGGGLPKTASQLSTGTRIFLPRNTNLKSGQFPVGLMHVLEQRQQFQIVMLLQVQAVPLCCDGQCRFQAIPQEYRATFLELGGEHLFLFREVGRHVLRPQGGDRL